MTDNTDTDIREYPHVLVLWRTSPDHAHSSRVVAGSPSPRLAMKEVLLREGVPEEDLHEAICFQLRDLIDFADERATGDEPRWRPAPVYAQHKPVPRETAGGTRSGTATEAVSAALRAALHPVPEPHDEPEAERPYEADGEDYGRVQGINWWDEVGAVLENYTADRRAARVALDGTDVVTASQYATLAEADATMLRSVVYAAMAHQQHRRRARE